MKPTEADTDAAASEPETEPESEPESEPETEAGEAAVPADGAAPAVPKLTAAENTADGIKITWEAVPDAEAYNFTGIGGKTEIHGDDDKTGKALFV